MDIILTMCGNIVGLPVDILFATCRIIEVCDNIHVRDI